jgi:hypothetical protein
MGVIRSHARVHGIPRKGLNRLNDRIFESILCIHAGFITSPVAFTLAVEFPMGCFKWFLILLLVLAVLAGLVFLVVKFGAVALWTIFGVLLVAAIVLAMTGKA